jgi:hypothetical protein
MIFVDMLNNVKKALEYTQEQLFEAIQNKDWGMVADVYTSLTGEEIEVDSDEKMINSQFQELLNRVNKLENNTTTSKSNKSTKQKKSKVDKTVANTRNKKSKDRVNKFDLMSDVLPEVDKEVGFDKIDDNIRPCHRDRPRFSTKEVTCRECKKSSEVHPMFAKENYICDKCLPKRGY